MQAKYRHALPQLGDKLFLADGGMEKGSAFGDSASAGPGASVKNRTVYFDYDRDEVKEEYRQIVADHGRYLAANPNARVRLEGHADERGSREYNIGLGERRAQSVRQSLLLQGAGASQLYGCSWPVLSKEAPARLPGSGGALDRCGDAQAVGDAVGQQGEQQTDAEQQPADGVEDGHANLTCG